MSAPPSGVMCRLSFLLVLLMRPLVVFSTAANKWDCNAGCPASPSPVCGQDDTTYANECLAVCQGVRVQSPKPCPGSTSHFKKASAAGGGSSLGAGSSSSTTIPVQAMNRYKKQGYTLLGVADPSKTTGSFKMPAYHPSQVDKMAAEVAKLGPAAYRSHRMEVSTGYVYQGPIPTHPGPPASPGYRSSARRPGPRAAAAASPGLPGGTNSTGGRRLREIFGKDDRKEVYLSSAYPTASIYSAIGQLVGTLSDGKLYTCSGTLVAWNAVLTAGHCVFYKGWSKGLRFYPGRSRRNGKSSSSYYDPYDSWPATHLHAFSAWTKGMNMMYDVGIVTLGSNNGYSAGDFAGGYMYLSEGSVKGTLQTAGYPAELAFGSMWRTQCHVSDTNANDQVIKTTACDMTSGDSGSPAWVATKMSDGCAGGAIKAVVSYTVCHVASCSPTRCCFDRGFNGLVQLSHSLVNSLYKWIDAPY